MDGTHTKVGTRKYSVRVSAIIYNLLMSVKKLHRSKYFSSIILGLNDSLIELTGALVGLSFAFGENLIVALAGLIVGVSASLSMTASAYMQARYEEGKNPFKAGLYTGLAYFIVVFLLVAPFMITSNILAALGAMLGVAFLIIASVSFYTSILFDRSFVRQFSEMLIASAGVALIAFAIGFIFRWATGVVI